MKISHNIKIEIDLASIPAPDLEDPATLDQIKQIALGHAERAIDAKHEQLRQGAKAVREAREKRGKE